MFERWLRRYGAFMAAIAALGGVTAIMWARRPTAARGPPLRHLRVVWTEDPAHSAVVLWTTSRPGRGEITWSPAPDSPEADRRTRSLDCGDGERLGSTSVYVHRCPLTDLEPSTRYVLRVQTGALASPERWFRTAPGDERAFSLLFGGDSRSDRTQRRKMNRRIAKLTVSEPNVVAFAHGGDYVVSGMRWYQWEAWLTDYELTTSTDGRLLPIIPARGNHERRGPLFGQIFGEPGGPGHYFTTRIGGFRLVTLNTETSMAGDQRRWLASTLAEAPAPRWLTAQYHRAAFPGVKAPSDALIHWVPLFERFDVDLVFESDGHVLKRTVPIRNGQRDPDGVVYVGEGGLGVAQRQPDADRWYFKDGGLAVAQHHVMVLSVYPDRLEYRAVGPSGKVVDRYRIDPKPRTHPSD